MPTSFNFTITDVSRFANKIDKTDTCWIWTGSIMPIGYGRIYIKGKNHYAHRLSMLFHTGKLTDNLVIDHTCRNRKCVNPSHLEEVTSLENIKRGGQAVKECKNGHIYTEENTYIKPDGRRNCKTCRAESVRRYQYANA